MLMASPSLELCRYCGKLEHKDNLVVTHGYWQGQEFHCHPQCKTQGEKDEALECQAIDADCNDCRHYRRGKLAPKTVSVLHKPDGSTALVTHQSNVFVGGLCLKFNRTTLACPHTWRGMECFEHRRS